MELDSLVGAVMLLEVEWLAVIEALRKAFAGVQNVGGGPRGPHRRLLRCNIKCGLGRS